MEFLQSSATTYKCLFKNGEDFFGGHAEFFELNQKQYNYKHKFYGTDIDDDCITNDYKQYCIRYQSNAVFTDGSLTSIYSKCNYIYSEPELSIDNKDKFDRFLTALILSLIVCLANIGLALFGFLLFRTPSDF